MERPQRTASPARLHEIESTMTASNRNHGIDEARRHMRVGGHDLAEQICRDLLAHGVDEANAWHLLGLCEVQRGRHVEALVDFDRALDREPANPGFLLNRGVSLQALGQSAAAEEAFRAALSINPIFPEALNNLANVLHKSGQAAAAIDAWRTALELRPNFSDASRNLATVLVAHGRAEEALDALTAATKLQPNDSVLAMARGDALVACRQYAEATEIYRTLLQSGAALGGIRTRLAHALRLDGKIEAALAEALLDLQLKLDNPDAHIQASAALGSLGRIAEAEAHVRQALYLRPDDPEACHNLALLLAGRRRTAEAIELFRTALRGNPDIKEATNALARAFSSQGSLDDAENLLRSAIRQTPLQPTFHAVLGEVLSNQGRLRESQAAFRESLRLDPAQPDVESSLLFTRLLDPDASPCELKSEHRAWASRHAQAAPLPSVEFDRDEERILRVGYVSPDLCGHVVAKFFLPVLTHHDRRRVHAICYADISSPDDVTRLLNRRAADWRLIRGCSDAVVANLIRTDHIDILVDLAGHTGTRLSVFGLRPAPLQVSWLGYPATTGVAAIPFMLCDRWTFPDNQDIAVEGIERLPTTFCCYEPSADAPPVSAPPYDELRRLTFGATHKLAKLNDAVLDTWCAVLRNVPDSRLLVYRDGLQGRAAEYLKRRLFERGLSADRLELRHRIRGGHLAIYSKIDILLDAWPWSGHATACEALWQGVPVLTLRGPRHVGRMVASTLEQVGLTDFIVDTRDEFIAKARSLASEPARLAILRRDLREMMRRSPLCDARRFTGEFEETLRSLWRRCVRGEFQ
jgi:protein O-GlcNAc transferase